jgi:hypothetical protein
MAGQWNPLESLGVAKGGAAGAARTGQSKATRYANSRAWIQGGRNAEGRKQVERAKEDEEGQEMGEARPCKYHGGEHPPSHLPIT